MADMVLQVYLSTMNNLVKIMIQNSSKSVKEEVEWLKGELQMMQCYLRDAAEKQGNDERVRYLTSEIKEAVQDAKDAIEIFNLKFENKIGSRSWRPLLEMCSCPLDFSQLSQIRVKIVSIRKRLDRIEINRNRYGIEELVDGTGKRVQSTRRSYEIDRWRWMPPWRKDDIVGFEDDVELLLRDAVLGERRGLVATIVGTGGIGKSTLAGKVYNHAFVAPHFDCRAWVVVSSEFRPAETMKELILQLLGSSQESLETTERLNLPHLQQMLHEYLKGKRYFIVMDDVWEDVHWSNLETAFPDEDNGSRLLLTSRNRDIAVHAQYVHEMKPLDPDKSWQLLSKVVFLGMKCPGHLESVGKEILKRCNGLPLAIKEVGARLSKEEPHEKNWEMFLKNMDSGGRGMSAMSAVLELSYKKLPLEKKLYFMCLGFFKEGATIRAEKMVQLCIAVNMVQQVGEDYDMEKMARAYLDTLISQNMVQVKDKTKDNRVKNCFISEVFHRIAITKAKEEISLEIQREEEKNWQPSGRCRHCSIYCNRERSLYSLNQDKYLRSLFVHGGGNLNGHSSYWRRFQLLRVLDFEDFGLKSLPRTIGSLTELRYLGLRNNYIQVLPSTLGRLKKLLVLDIALNYMVEVPNVLWKMNSLCHLYMSDIICKTPLKIDALKDLQTLTYISLYNWAYEFPALQMMTSLRKLGIQDLDEHSDLTKVFTSLSKLGNLECLNLRGFRFRSMPSLEKLGVLRHLTQLKLDGHLTTLPNANNFPPNLSYLTLVNTSLDVDPMPLLHKLSKLLYLKLRNAYSGDEMVISHDGFPHLQVICFSELWNLRNVEVETGAMPKLKQWEINSCPSLENLRKEGDKDRIPPDFAKSFFDRQRKGKFVEPEAQVKHDEIVETIQSSPPLSQTEVRKSHVFGSKDGTHRKRPSESQAAYIKGLESKLYELERENKNLKTRMDEVRNGHVFGSNNATRRKHFNEFQAAYIEELESKLHKTDEENKNLKTRMDEIETRLAQIEKNDQPHSDAPSTSGNDIDQ